MQGCSGGPRGQSLHNILLYQQQTHKFNLGINDKQSTADTTDVQACVHTRALCSLLCRACSLIAVCSLMFAQVPSPRAERLAELPTREESSSVETWTTQAGPGLQRLVHLSAMSTRRNCLVFPSNLLTFPRCVMKTE